MGNKIIKNCPSCGGKLHISQLKCDECGIAINGVFDEEKEATPFSSLNDDEIKFVKLFLKHEGNLSSMNKQVDLGYGVLKSKLREINAKIGNAYVSSSDDEVANEYKVPDNCSVASKKIIEKFKEYNGHASCSMLRGEPLQIWITEEGVRNSGYADLVCEWRILDAIFNKAIELGGKMYRGDSYAQNGVKIGTYGLELDTIDGFISTQFYGKQVGDTTLRRSTYFSAILAWAGLCTNHRSDGRGGYITINGEYLK